MPYSIRTKALLEWRGLPSHDPATLDRCHGVDDLLKKLLPKLGLEERLQEEEIHLTWSAIVGDFIATHSKPIGLKNGVLSIRVFQPTIRYELERFWRSKLLANLQAKFGSKRIKSIRFQV